MLLLLFQPAADIAGSATPTLSALTASGAGTFAVPTYSGVGNSPLSAMTVAGSGTSAAPGYSGAGTPSLGSLTASAAGTSTAPIYSGSGAAALSSLTVAGAGTSAAPGTVTGSGTPSLSALAVAGSGTSTVPTYSGSGSPSLGAMAASGVGTGGTLAYAGVGNSPLTDLTAVGVGEYAASTAYAGTGAPALGALAVTASASYTGPASSLPLRLLGAIVARFRDTPALSALLPGGLHKGLAPPKLSPGGYAEIFKVGAAEWRSTGSTVVRREVYKVRFFCPTDLGAVSAAMAWEGVFNPAMVPLQFQTGYTLAARITDEREMERDERGPNAVNLFGLVLTMECLVGLDIPALA